MIENHNKNGIVISAFPCTGKTTFTKENSNKYNISDSDSSKFSWIFNNSEKIRNENFVNDYYNHIIHMREKNDIVFVSTHEEIRRKLTDEKIPFVTIYPKKDLLNEYIGRMYRRNNDVNFINKIIKFWDYYQEDVKLNRYMGFDRYTFSTTGEYISNNVIRLILESYNQIFNENKIINEEGEE